MARQIASKISVTALNVFDAAGMQRRGLLRI
jgi:hypothetical protein